MAILVTRPHPDNETTAAALRARDLTVVLAPMLRLEEVAFRIDADLKFGAIMVTSANALRAIALHPVLPQLLGLPLFAVGDHTAETATRLGFQKVMSASGDATALRNLLVAQAKAKTLSPAQGLLYLAGADLARNLAGELNGHGFDVHTVTTYRMTPVQTLSAAALETFAQEGFAAVMHYSRRSARAFVEAARGAGIEITALGIPQVCISEAVAGVMREAGAPRVLAADTPDEIGLFAALDRALTPISR
jgi:uroporphyrinogen-III synthase